MSILFRATRKGTFLCFRMSMLSSVWFSRPFSTSTTTTAMSAAEPPLSLRLEKMACPGVSMTSNPGTFSAPPALSRRGPHIFSRVSRGKKLAPISCVIPPTSRAPTAVPLILSSSEVFPASTWPSTTTTGCRSRAFGSCNFDFLSYRTLTRSLAEEDSGLLREALRRV